MNSTLTPAVISLCALLTPNTQAMPERPTHLLELRQATQLQTVRLDMATLFIDQNQPVDPVYIESLLSDLMEAHAIEESERCQELQLHIYFIPDAVLNDRSIMHFITWEAWGDQDIWGAYDSFYSPDIGEIYVSTTASNEMLSRTLAHEYFHHYQDATCRAREEEPAVHFAHEFHSHPQENS